MRWITPDQIIWLLEDTVIKKKCLYELHSLSPPKEIWKLIVFFFFFFFFLPIAFIKNSQMEFYKILRYDAYLVHLLFFIWGGPTTYLMEGMVSKGYWV